MRKYKVKLDDKTLFEVEGITKEDAKEGALTVLKCCIKLEEVK